MNTIPLKNVIKKMPFDTDACIQKIETIDYYGNITPKIWYKRIKTEKGATDFNAITLLAEIVYRYRRIHATDDNGLDNLKKQFHSDMWQQTNTELADTYDLTKLQVAEALGRLERQGLIIRELRTVKTKRYGKLPNIQFLAPVADKVCELSWDEKRAKKKADKSSGSCAGKVYRPNKNNSKGYARCADKGIPPAQTETLQRDYLENKEEEGSILKTLSALLESLPEKIAAAVFQLNEKKENDGTAPSPTTVSTSPIGKLPVLTLMPQEGIIREELTENQKAFALQYIANKAKVTEERLPTLTEEILVGLVVPTCFPKCGVEFLRKLNTILKSVENGTWSAPVSMLLKEKTQEDTETKLKKEALNALIIKHREALVSYAHWGKTIGFHVGRPEQQENALLHQKKAWHEVIKLTEQLKNEDPEMKLAAIPPEPVLARTIERKIA